MSRHERIEGILHAPYELETAAPADRPRCEVELWALVDVARSGTHLTRFELVRALEDRYRQYKRAQREAQRRKLSI